VKLSDKLSAIAESFGMMYDHYETMEQAIALAKRYEDAPVRMVGESTSYSASVAGTGIKNGQRVRIVLDKEG
jgi:hypothetical protein